MLLIGYQKITHNYKILHGNYMKDFKGEWKDIFWGAVAAILMLAPAMIVYVWKTGGVS